MNRIFFLAITCSVMFIGIKGIAEQGELKLESRDSSFSNAVKNNELFAGQSSGHSGVIGNTEYMSLWNYWYVNSGNKPENFDLKPMCYNKSTGWGDIFKNDKDNRDSLFCTKYFFYAYGKNQGNGCGFSITNQLNKKTCIIIEGYMAFYENSKLYIYKKNPAGEITKLTSNDIPGSVFINPTKQDDGSILQRKYLKLQINCDFLPGDQIYVIGMYESTELESANIKAGNLTIFSTNDRWGPMWQPSIYIQMKE